MVQFSVFQRCAYFCVCLFLFCGTRKVLRHSIFFLSSGESSFRVLPVSTYPAEIALPDFINTPPFCLFVDVSQYGDQCPPGI